MTGSRSNSIYRNHLSIFDPNRYNQYSITIVGCGSIGSFTALTLAKMGFVKLILMDNDKIEEHNLPTQFLHHDYIGNPKTNCLSSLLRCYSECKPVGLPIKYKKTIPFMTEIVIVCTDNMKSRKDVYEGCIKSKVRLLIDARMSGEAFSVFTVNLTDKKDCKRYEKSFHRDRRLPCTAKGILYNVNMIVAVIGSQLVRVLKNKKYSWVVNGDTKNLVLLKE